MDATAPAVRPNVLIPKTFGFLNIILGFFFMGCGTCYTVYVPGLASLGTVVKERQKTVAEENRVHRQSEIAALKKQEADASDETEKKSIRGQIDVLENTPSAPPEFDFGVGDFGFGDKRVLAHFVIDAGSGLLLNFLMFASGIGLVLYKNWARVMAIGLAWVKVVRMLALTASLVFFVVPTVTSTTDQFVRSQAAQMTAEAKAKGKPSEFTPEEAAEIGRGFRSMGSTLSILLLVLGSVYPIVSIALLTRPSAAAACRRKGIKEAPREV